MRGYQKKVIYLKNMGSKNFEEAYFVLRSDAKDTEKASVKMIEEANKIIDENFSVKKRSFLYSKRWYIISFLSGILVMLLVGIIWG